MAQPHAASRRARFAGRVHELHERDRGPLAPAPGHPVVVDGRKYRIHDVSGRGDGPMTARLHDRFTPGLRPNGPTVTLTALGWDRIAGVWRPEGGR